MSGRVTDEAVRKLCDEIIADRLSYKPALLGLALSRFADELAAAPHMREGEAVGCIVTTVHGEKLGPVHDRRSDAVAYVGMLQANRILKGLAPGNYNIEPLFRNAPPKADAVDLEALAEEFKSMEGWITTVAASAIVRRYLDSSRSKP